MPCATPVGRIVLELVLPDEEEIRWRCGTVYPRRRSSGGRILAASVVYEPTIVESLGPELGCRSETEDHKVGALVRGARLRFSPASRSNRPRPPLSHAPHTEG